MIRKPLVWAARIMLVVLAVTGALGIYRALF